MANQITQQVLMACTGNHSLRCVEQEDREKWQKEVMSELLVDGGLCSSVFLLRKMHAKEVNEPFFP